MFGVQRLHVAGGLENRTARHAGAAALPVQSQHTNNFRSMCLLCTAKVLTLRMLAFSRMYLPSCTHTCECSTHTHCRWTQWAADPQSVWSLHSAAAPSLELPSCGVLCCGTKCPACFLCPARSAVVGQHCSCAGTPPCTSAPPRRPSRTSSPGWCCTRCRRCRQPAIQ